MLQTDVILNTLPKNMNPALRRIIKNKCREYDVCIQRLEELRKDISQFNTKQGDPVDRANSELALSDHDHLRQAEQLRLQKIENVINNLKDPYYEGLCTACEDTKVFLLRISKHNSTICPDCAKRAETH
jgi:RNA polymerase-binding transcription factor DksA